MSMNPVGTTTTDSVYNRYGKTSSAKTSKEAEKQVPLREKRRFMRREQQKRKQLIPSTR